MRMIVWVVVALGLVMQGWGQQVIPAVRATSLAGTTVVLPDGTKRPMVLILGFSQKSSDAARMWGQRCFDAVPKGLATVYTLPVLAGAPRLVRGLIVRSLKKDIPAVVQGEFVPLYDNEEEWKKVAGFDKPDEVYVLVVDAGGVVRWRVEGGVTDARLGELVGRLKGLVG